MREPQGGWRIVTLVVLFCGAAVSAGLTWYAGRQSPVRALVWLFVFWVLSPFVGLALATAGAKRWPPPVRRRLHTIAFVVTIISLVAYAVRVYSPPRAQGAFTFLVVPGLAWVIIAVIVGTAAAMSRRRG